MTEQHRERTILQIIPTNGWFVRYSPSQGHAGCLYPLACWALVDSTPDGKPSPKVEGILFDDTGESCFCSEDQCFECYVHESQLQFEEYQVGVAV
jgi:hypothetical protein